MLQAASHAVTARFCTDRTNERISQPAVDGCDGLATVTVSGADVEVVQAMASARPRRTLTPIQRLGLISVLGRLYKSMAGPRVVERPVTQRFRAASPSGPRRGTNRFSLGAVSTFDDSRRAATRFVGGSHRGCDAIAHCVPDHERARHSNRCVASLPSVSPSLAGPAICLAQATQAASTTSAKMNRPLRIKSSFKPR